ncbi:unnamed protein product [Lasius platythorax]|uniref:Uncharacterized protein n=1 Tax=Lasius platythorax TaxID=488582 RepID=A0AAV2P5H5_9HYME
MNYGKQAISRGLSGIGPTCSGNGGRRAEGREDQNGGCKKCSQWDDKSNFRSDCTEPWAIVAFYMQSRVKLWQGKGGDSGGGSCDPGRTIVLLADRKHHCTTTAVRVVAAI